ncbi:amino acid ABC transporter ATP-binding protein [bacterium]|jgi:ABC-type polar amino acid transport system ATPase subunit|nr:amino acid ABC transporter ATP-binding protein [bacterium]
MLKIENISKTYGEKKVLNKLSLDLKRGEVAVLMGASGTGKTTLLRILNSLEKADCGSVFLDNKKLDLEKINRTHTIGIVFQSFNLFKNMNVTKNITISLEKTLNYTQQKATEIAQTLLKKYGLENHKDHFISELSGGQKQRLAIARTIALKPKVVCLDEPTSALDPMLTTHVAKTIEGLAKEGYHIIVSTHDTHLIEQLDCTIYLMENGKIIEAIPSQEISTNNTKYSKIKRFIAGSLEEKV